MNELIRIAIIGRPNVGKSTLFNRLFGRKRALVHDEPGVTRDRLEEITTWWVRAKSYQVKLIDTGGLGGERFSDEIARQVTIALSEADVALMVFDGQAGLIGADREILQNLQKNGVLKRTQVIGVVNKVDANQHEEFLNDFYSAGLDELLTISAEHGRGIQDLQEKIIELLGLEAGQNVAQISARLPADLDDDLETPESELDLEEFEEVLDTQAFNEESGDESDEKEDEPLSSKSGGIPKVAIVGRPNVGKSTFVNALAQKERMITSPIAGTTIDSVDSIVEIEGKQLLLIDTAGIRRKGKTEQGVEVLSVVQTRKALERCQVAALMVDAEAGITDQDEKIGGLIEDVGCAVIIVVNKWDTQKTDKHFNETIAAAQVREKMAFLRYAPILFVSALKGQGYEAFADLVEDILTQRQVKISTHEFTKWVREESEIHNPMNAKFYLSHQSGRHPPTFVCHVSDPKKVHFSLRRHLSNALRKKWGFMGNPVRLLFVEAKSTRKPKYRT